MTALLSSIHQHLASRIRSPSLSSLATKLHRLLDSNPHLQPLLARAQTLLATYFPDADVEQILLTSLLPLLALLVLSMAWLGRFSPFTRSDDRAANQNNTTVSDSDFSYITTDDLAKYIPSPSSGGSAASGPSRDDDILLLKHQRVSYPLHFPRGSIDGGELTVGALRAAAARKMGVPDPRRLRLFWKGRVLKEDRALVREVGMRSGMRGEILCVLGEGSGEDGGEDDEDEAEESETGRLGGSSAGGRKKRNRRGGKKAKGKKTGLDQSAPASASASQSSFVPNAEYLPLPTGATPRPSSAPPPAEHAKPPPSSAAPAGPQSALGKLAAIERTFHADLVPRCEQFVRDPPADPKKREFEHKYLTETIMGQVLLKLDGVEAEGDDAVRQRRKALVREVQGVMGRLDKVGGVAGGP